MVDSVSAASSVSKQVSVLGPLSSRTEKQIARLLVCTSYHKPFSPGFEDSGPSADTYFDAKRLTCPQPAAFLSRRTCITPSTHTCKVVGKTSKQTIRCTGCILRGHVAIIT